MKFLIATNNPNKKNELSRILKPLGIEAVTAKEVGISLNEVEETGKTFAENARIKAEAALKLSNMPCVADDSGLSVDALNGEPGIYSARYAGENASNEERIQKLLNNMKNVPDEKRQAHFISSVYCIFPDGKIITAEGYCYGKIGFKTKGQNGFGYDPIFVTQSGKTFAELSSKEKDKISHRGNSLKEFIEKLSKFLETNS